jgi:hypothetical protein
MQTVMPSTNVDATIQQGDYMSEEMTSGAESTAPIADESAELQEESSEELEQEAQPEQTEAEKDHRRT